MIDKKDAKEYSLSVEVKPKSALYKKSYKKHILASSFKKKHLDGVLEGYT